LWHDRCHKWSRNCLSFRSTWVHPRFLVGLMLLDLLQGNHMAKFGKDLIYRTKVIVQKPVWTPARHRHTQSHNTARRLCLSSFFWSFYCLSFYDLQLLITLLIYSNFSYLWCIAKLKEKGLTLYFHNNQEDKHNLQNTTQKTKDRVTLTPLKTEGELRCSGRISSSCSTCVLKINLFSPWYSWKLAELALSYISLTHFISCQNFFSVPFSTQIRYNFVWPLE
jgi:hypothetical protein